MIFLLFRLHKSVHQELSLEGPHSFAHRYVHSALERFINRKTQTDSAVSINEKGRSFVLIKLCNLKETVEKLNF